MMNRAAILMALLPGALLCVSPLSATPSAVPPRSARPASFGLSVAPDGTLRRGGKAFRGVGVNYFDAFYRTLLRPGDVSYEAGFRVLAQHKIPFARFMACGFWPADMKLYRENRSAYLARLDGVVRAAERHGIGLIPSLFWHPGTVPDLVGEPCDTWGNARSKTHEFMRRYTREVVTRYRNSPAIWGWEFGNEYNLAADLPNAAGHRPQIATERGTPATRSARDELSHDAIRVAFAEFAREVRRHDPSRIIAAGNAMPRASAWHQRREKSWTKDTPQQFAEMLRDDNPGPMDVLSVHCYSEDAERLAGAMEAARRAKKPLFVGEFGVPDAPSPERDKQFKALLENIERHQVPLSALWVFDFSNQTEWSVTANNARSAQLRAIARANERMRADTVKRSYRSGLIHPLQPNPGREDRSRAGRDVNLSVGKSGC